MRHHLVHIDVEYRMAGDMTDSTKMDLSVLVRSAFPEVPVPRRKKIVVSDDPESKEIVRDFGKRKWSEIPFETLFWHRESLFMMSETGIRYYLPAYLLAMVERYDETDLMPDAVISSLTPDELWRERSGEYDRLIRGFTQRQIEAVCAVLQWLHDAHGDDFDDGEAARAIRCIKKSYQPGSAFS